MKRISLGWLASAILLCSCVHNERPIGYISPNTEEIINSPGTTDFEDRAVLKRDANSNRLNLRISGPYREHLSTSFKSNYEILLSLTTSAIIPAASQETFIPGFNTEHIKILGSTVSTAGHQLEIRMSADRVGVDRIIASVAAPGGVRGLLLQSDGVTSFPLQAQAFESEAYWGRLWSRRDWQGRPCIGFENRSEFVFVVLNIGFSDGAYLPLQMKVEPYQRRWRCFSNAHSSVPTKVASRRVRSVPGISNWLNN